MSSDDSDYNLSRLEFEVNYFDMPLMENTKLPDGHRVAVTLKAVDLARKTAAMKIFELDHDRLRVNALDWKDVKHQLDSVLKPEEHRPHDSHDPGQSDAHPEESNPASGRWPRILGLSLMGLPPPADPR